MVKALMVKAFPGQRLNGQSFFKPNPGRGFPGSRSNRRGGQNYLVAKSRAGGQIGQKQIPGPAVRSRADRRQARIGPAGNRSIAPSNRSKP